MIESSSPPDTGWRLPSPLTAAASEAMLASEESPLLIRAERKTISGPGGDSRLLALLARRRAARLCTRTALGSVIEGAAPDSAGWTEVGENPILHLLAHYSTELRDHKGSDQLRQVRDYQATRRGGRGLVTTTSGQTAVLVSNAEVASGQTRSIFATQSAVSLSSSLNQIVKSRGLWSIEPQLISYVAEAIENVREHASLGSGTDPQDLCMLQVKFTNRARLALVENLLPPTSPFRASLRALAAEQGKRFIGLVELSVSDTGPGIASSLAGRPAIELDQEEELDLLQRAFQPNVSRKPTKGSGGGLPTMLEKMIDMRGAIQVRSGRWSLYNSGPDSSSAKFWSPISASPAPGTGITLIFPVIRGVNA